MDSIVRIGVVGIQILVVFLGVGFFLAILDEIFFGKWHREERLTQIQNWKLNRYKR